MPKRDRKKYTDLQRVELHASNLLKALRYDLQHPDIVDTPKRLASLMQEYVKPKGGPPEVRTFPTSFNSMVGFIDHRAYTKCPHHLETVELDISMAYIPNGKLLGTSKFARVADYMAKGLMLQEEIPEMIADSFMDILDAKGFACYTEGRHMCVRSRGVKSYNSVMTSTVVRGMFFDDVKTREEFFNTIMLVRMGRR